jgi:hypothetical protein
MSRRATIAALEAALAGSAARERELKTAASHFTATVDAKLLAQLADQAEQLAASAAECDMYKAELTKIHHAASASTQRYIDSLAASAAELSAARAKRDEYINAGLEGMKNAQKRVEKATTFAATGTTEEQR